MPRAPKKCGRPDCENRVTARPYCPDHQPMTWPGGPRASTAEHKRWRLAVLDRDGWACQIRGPRCLGHADEADHITPTSAGGATTLDNGQAVCGPCHQTKTLTEAAAARRR